MQRRIENVEGWRWHRDAPAMALLLALPLVFLNVRPGAVPPYGGDILVHVYPLLSLLAHGLHSGRPTLWNFYAAGGYPLAPYGALALSPPVAVALLALPVAGAITALYVCYLAVFGSGAYLLAGDLGQSRCARLLAAITLEFSGFVAAHIYAGHIFELGAICPLPLAFLLLRRAILRHSLIAALWCGALLGLMILAAGLQFLPFALAPLPLLALWHSAARLRGGQRDGLSVAWPLIALAVAGIVGAALGAVYLLPFQEILGATLRAQPISYALATMQSLPWDGLTLLVAPNGLGNPAANTYWPASPSSPYFHEIYAYAGLLPLLLAPLAPRRRAAWPYGLLALLALLVMLGGNTPLYALLYHLPGGSLLRAPARAGLVFDFALALLAGFGLDALRDLARAGAWRNSLAWLAPGIVLVAVTLAGLLATAALSGSQALPAARPPALAGAVRLLVALALALLACGATARDRRFALALPALAVIDLFNANGVLIRPFNPATPYSHVGALRALPASSAGYRFMARDGAVPLGLGMVTRRLYDVQDAAPLALSDYWRLCHPSLVQRAHGGVVPTSRDVRCDANPLFLRLFGVRTVFNDVPLHVPALQPAGAITSTRWSIPGGAQWNVYPYSATSLVYRDSAVLPRVFTVSRALQAGSAAEALQWLRSGRVNPLRSAAVLSPAPGAYSGVLAALQSAWAGWLGADVDNGLQLRADGGGSGGYLVIDDGWFPGWTATVDGRAAPVLRADYLLRAVRLPPGRHVIHLVYAPLIFLLGALITVTTACLIIGLSVVSAMRALRRRHAGAAPEITPTAGLIGAKHT